MLRLWPERLSAGVFPDCGWVHRRGKHELATFTDVEGTNGGLLTGLDALLGERSWPRRGRVDLIVSDQYARVIHLPWQDGLTNETQQTAYGKACFENAGFELAGEWLIHARYRRFATDGVAYALPRDIVLQVRDRLAMSGLTLASILPLSGAAYWRHGAGVAKARNVLLLEESRRISALLFDRSKYIGMHVQPSGTAPAEAMRRLINSVDATFSEVKQVQYWSVKEMSGRQELFKERWPDATVKVLPTSRWN